MNVFQLVLKQMRQRALSTWLTLLSVVLGVGLATTILLLYRQGEKLFAQSDFGFDVVVGAKTGGNLNTILNAVYQLGSPGGTINYRVYDDLVKNPDVRWAIPWAVGDNYRGHRLIGTSAGALGFDETGQPLPAEKTFEYRPGKRLELAGGKAFHSMKFEAVIGADVAERTGLSLGAAFKASHGAEAASEADEHDETWKVVGILRPTHTALDRIILIPIVSALAVPSHAQAVEDIYSLQAAHGSQPARHSEPAGHPEAHDDHDHAELPATPATKAAAPHGHAGHEGHDHDAYCLADDGTIDLHLEREKWRLSAVLVRCIFGRAQNVIFTVNNLPDAAAVNPAREMRAFFDTFFAGSRMVLLLISAMVTIVAAVGILVSIYNSVSARLREIAILRALGATRGKVLSLICLEAAGIGLAGSVLGLLLGHALGGVASVFFERLVGESVDFVTLDPLELVYVLGVVALSALAGLIPALKAYRTSVATHLSA